jgi:hypothetical protein
VVDFGFGFAAGAAPDGGVREPLGSQPPEPSATTPSATAWQLRKKRFTPRSLSQFEGRV